MKIIYGEIYWIGTEQKGQNKNVKNKESNENTNERGMSSEDHI